MRRAAKAVLRPFASPLLRSYAGIGRRIDQVNALVERLDGKLPIVENVIESQNAELRVHARVTAELRGELDRLRSDLTRAQSEIRALQDGAARATAAARRQPPPTPTGELRLAIGLGPASAPDHVAVDLREAPAGDLASHLLALPYAPCSAVEILADQALERFSLADLRAVVLPRCRALLKPGGLLVVIAADAGANLADYQAGSLGLDELTARSFGAGEDATPPRRSMLNEALLRELLEGAGFQSVETAARRRGPGGANLIEVRARGAGQEHAPAEIAPRTGTLA